MNTNDKICLPCQQNPFPAVPAPPPCDGEKCDEIYPAECVAYNGSDLLCYDIKKHDRLDVILSKIEAKCPFRVDVIKHILEIIRDTPILNDLFCQISCSCDCNPTPPPCTCQKPGALTITYI